MEGYQRIRLLLATGLLLGGLALVALLALPTTAGQWLGAARARPAQPAAAAGTTYGYVGVVDLDQVVPGVLDEPLGPLMASPDELDLPELGQIDLAFRLIESGQVVTGHVDLEYTLVFSGEHWLEDRWFGPAVQGSFDGSSLSLMSDPFSYSSAGQTLTRQFSLSGQQRPDQEDQFSGEYRETLWGYGPQPFTVVGTFTLRRAIYVAPPIPHYEELFLPVVAKQ